MSNPLIDDDVAKEISDKQLRTLKEEVNSLRYRTIQTISYIDLVSDEKTSELYDQLAVLLNIIDKTQKALEK